VKPDLAIVADLKHFLAALAKTLDDWRQPPSPANGWRGANSACSTTRTCSPEQREFKGKINPYHFIEELFAHLDGDDIVACGNATATIVPFQAGSIKPGMRMFSNSGSASMGYDLPAAIGASFGALAARGNQQRDNLPGR
jgi:acetolactate synthase-1/2/3 large subunit